MRKSVGANDKTTMTVVGQTVTDIAFKAKRAVVPLRMY